ncbi:MAG: protein phosphatase 2C domain-containing protein [Ferruginibacter sp.]
MSETKKYIQSLFSQNQIPVKPTRTRLFEEFINAEKNILAVNTIKQQQDMLKQNWTIKNKIADIMDKQIVIPNGNVNKPYEAKIDFIKYGITGLKYTGFEGLDKFGLLYNSETQTLSGTPNESGDFKLTLQFRMEEEENDAVLNEKIIALVINADPKSLWKEIASDLDKDDAWKTANYWKPDRANDFATLGTKNIVAASNRGRSHANVGSCRDDDYAFAWLEAVGWAVVCVADGAGSSSVSRQGSKLACGGVIEYFQNNFTPEMLIAFDLDLKQQYENPNEASSKRISFFVYDNLSKAALHAHKKIEDFALKAERPIKDFHSTLIFSLYKKYDFGYALLTFGVGDCPIALLNKDLSEVKLMNWLDVGEFGGGTRFITMPEIFTSDKFSTRFGFKLIDDFAYLFMMTDGIYDPKFVVEANLDKIDNWKAFVADLQGTNEDKAAVDFSGSNTHIANQLSVWMDFWSPGNHDDRTLAVIF